MLRGGRQAGAPRAGPGRAGPGAGIARGPASPGSRDGPRSGPRRRMSPLSPGLRRRVSPPQIRTVARSRVLPSSRPHTLSPWTGEPPPLCSHLPRCPPGPVVPAGPMALALTPADRAPSPVLRVHFMCGFAHVDTIVSENFGVYTFVGGERSVLSVTVT